jgi:muramoyltetrapeptide carboxypeptidase
MRNRVQIIAPSSGHKNAEELLRQGIDLLKEWGFSVQSTDNLFAAEYIFCANSSTLRLRSLREAILSPEVDIIWCFSGGYGAGEIASKCTDIRPSHNKILIGYSDITVLHGLFNWHYHIPSIHASGLRSLLEKHKHHMQDILDILHGKKMILKLDALTPSARSISIDSTLTGGNLTMLTTMIGTKLHPDARGKILVLEDIDEKGYRVSRSLNHLREAGIIQEVSAIIFGSFTNSDEHLEYALQRFCDEHQNIPIFHTAYIGHGAQNTPLVFGSKAEIKDCVLTICSPC